MSSVLDEVEAPDVILEDNTPIVQPDSNRSKMANRFLFLALDVLTPSRKRACKRLGFGGHELTSECLVTRNFVQKGRITGLVRSGEPILEENVPDGSDFFVMPQPKRIEVAGALAMQGMSESPLGAIPAYPGDHFSSIMNGSASEIDGRKIGLVEIRALIGFDYQIEQIAPGLRVDKRIFEINRYFFPTFPAVPVLLTEFRAQIQAAYSATADTMLRSMAEDMLQSCEVGSLWATETLDAKERLMVQGGPQQGYAYVYDELEESLLVQMGRAKASQGMTKIATQFAEIAQSGRADMAQLAQIITSGNREFAELLLKGLQAEKPAEPESKKPAIKKNDAMKTDE